MLYALCDFLHKSDHDKLFEPGVFSLEVVPRGKASEVLRVALEIEEVENLIEESVRKGMTIKEAREKYRYHSLQSRK